MQKEHTDSVNSKIITVEHCRHAFSCNTQWYYISITASLGYKRSLFEQQWIKKNPTVQRKKIANEEKFVKNKCHCKVEHKYIYKKCFVS